MTANSTISGAICSVIPVSVLANETENATVIIAQSPATVAADPWGELMHAQGIELG